MNDSLQEYLNVVKPYLSDALLSPQVLTRVEKVAKLIPQLSPTKIFPALLECRLEAGQSQVDLSVGLQPVKIPAITSLSSYPFWQQLHQFSEDWTTPGSLPCETIKDIWLEFDLDGQNDIPAVACWFFTLEADAFKDKSAEARSKLLKIVSLLQNCPVDERRAALLHHCLDVFPERVGIVEIGAMLTRTGAPIRLDVLGLSPETIPSFLAQIQGKEIDANFSEIVTTFGNLTDSIVLCFDIGKKIGSRIGLECFLDNQPKKEPRWIELLDLLVTMGCCTSEKRDALLSWPGLLQQKSAFDAWPSDLKNLRKWMGRDNISVFWRTINHVKLVYQPDKHLEAKAYLCFGHRWFKLK